MQAFNTYLRTQPRLFRQPARLTSVIGYHIIPSVIRVADIPIGTTSVKTLQGGNVTISKDASGVVTVNGAKVIQADVVAGAGVVHEINSVLQPQRASSSLSKSTGLQIPPPSGTIATAASGIPDLSTFAAAVAASPSISALAKAPLTPMTVFAPTNEASDPAPCAQTNS